MAHLIAFTLGFSIEVKVHASEHPAPAAHAETATHAPADHDDHASKENETPEDDSVGTDSAPVQLAQAEAPLQEPQNCIATKRTCAVRTETNEKFTWVEGDVTLTLDRGSSIRRETPTLSRLIDGTVWVEAKSEFTIRTEFGDVKLTNGGEMWVTREADRIVVHAPMNDVIVRARGSKEDLLIETGSSNWMSKVALKTGEAETGLPTAIPFREHVERWARLYPGKRKDFRIAVRSFHGRWSRAVEKTATLHKIEFERKIAAIEGDNARKAEAARKREVEDKKLRDLFRKKVFEGL